jgi:hypothetical protein
MRDEALFINGMFEDVLEDILTIQAHLPEQILYLQPYSGSRIVHLAENPPSVDDPVRLLLSLTRDLPRVHYVCEIVGWDDKRKLKGRKLTLLNRIIYAFQWTEEGVHPWAYDPDRACVNLLYVRRMRKLSRPFSVANLILTSSGESHSIDRTTPGGWSYVVNPSDEWLEEYL